jgi:hypothetical protein
MNKLFDVLIITLSIVIANSVAMAMPSPSANPGLIAPSGGAIVARYECRSRGLNTGPIILRANNKYDAKQQTGRYQTSKVGYRFLTGPFQGQSIVHQNSNTYFVNTKIEAKAAEAATYDAAAVCTGGVIDG